MTNRALTLFSLPAIAAALLIAAPASAQTECQPDDLFCAELRIGPGRAGVRIGGGQPQPPPPPVVVEPAPQPPVVIVEPQAPIPPPPPVVVQPQPQPPTVIVQPAPPPPPPQQQYVVAPIQRPVLVRPQNRFPYSSIGLHLHLDGLAGDDLGMGGGGAAIRFRPMPHIGIDIGASFYGGQDWNGLDRVEIPLQADVLFFLNPEHRFQVYALVGVGASFSHAVGYNDRINAFDNRDYAHLGGEVGLGLEWRISRVFAMNLDVRGFIRQRVDENDRAEFVDPSTGQQTDTSGGVVGRVGMTFYFGE